MSSENAVSASAKGATTLIILQIGSRAITFALNQILLRFLSPELLGASVQLEIYKIGVQYFSRESLRVAAERRSYGGVQAAINLSYLAILANIPLGFAFAEWYRGTELMAQVPRFGEALRVCQFAAFLELLMEPAFTTVQQNMLYGARAAAEGTSVILKTLTVFAIFFWAHRQGKDLGVLPFAIGEVVNSVTLTVVYWAWTMRTAQVQGFSLFPKQLKSRCVTTSKCKEYCNHFLIRFHCSPDVKYILSLFSQPLLYLILSLFFQTGIKWLLTEGDKMLILPLATLQEQGIYALAANYGGLVARMIFQPIEISSRNLFANLCATPAQPSMKEKEAKPQSAPSETSPPTKPRSSSFAHEVNIATAANILRDILRAYAIISTICFALGPIVAPLLLRLVAGPRWTNRGAGSVLGTYTFYIPFLAINGVSEAFVAATASTKDLRYQTFWMAGFSALFGLSAWLFLSVLKLGAEGFIWANCVNMALRIAFNMHYIQGFFHSRGQVRHILQYCRTDRPI